MVKLEIWLYGPLSRFAPGGSQGSHAQVVLEMPGGTRMKDLLARLEFPIEEKGITFVNGELTDMPGLRGDLDRELVDGDRVAFFHDKSMWPYQYRFGATVSNEVKEGGIHHSYSSAENAGREE